MDQPFLDSEYWALSTDREILENRRDQAIAEAVEAYLAACDGNPIPGKENVEMPEPLEWLYRLRAWREIYGQVPLRAGGLEDQPMRFTRDLEAALLGERMRISAAEANLRNKIEYAGKKSVEDVAP